MELEPAIQTIRNFVEELKEEFEAKPTATLAGTAYKTGVITSCETILLFIDNDA